MDAFMNSIHIHVVDTIWAYLFQSNLFIHRHFNIPIQKRRGSLWIHGVLFTENIGLLPGMHCTSLPSIFVEKLVHF